MNRKNFFVGILAAGCFIASSMLMPSVGTAQDAKVKAAMDMLKAETAKLGAPKLDGKEAVSGKDASALYFGTTKINNNFTIVDAVVKAHGGTATLFARTGDEYVRVSTNVPKDNGRATGTVLDMKAAAGMAIAQGKAYYGPVNILGKPYITGYEPIKDGSGKVIGIWYVGYAQ